MIKSALIRKFLCFAAVCGVMALAGPSAYATNSGLSRSAVEVTAKSVASKSGGLAVEGSMPIVSGLTSPTLQAELNSLIQQSYTSKIEAAGVEKAKSVRFEQELKSWGDYHSIIVRVSTASVSTLDEFRTFVFSASGKLLAVNDVLGLNGVKIINKLVEAEMLKKPGTYNPDFAGVPETQSFYVENGSVVVVFDKYALGSAALGTPQFEISISGVRNNTFTIGKTDSYPKDPYNVKMIPLRMVASGLGFGLNWEPRERLIDITRDNSTVASLAIGKNSYFKSKNPALTLEFPPELDENGVTHLPISFFERILDVCYTVDQAGSITFSYYVP